MLPLRIQPRDGEPAYAVFARLAHRHGAEQLRSFAAEIDFSWSGTVASIDPVAVANLAGLRADRLAWDSPRIDPATRVVELAGQKLLLNDWTLRPRRYCASCFVSDRLEATSAGLPADFGPWHRGCWDIRSYDVCHHHHVALNGVCPACHAPLGWVHSRVDECPCGADLAAFKPVDGDAGVALYIASRLGLAQGPRYPLLDSLDLRDALAVLARLGFCAEPVYRAQRPRSRAQERAAARHAGLAIADDWPRALEACLDRLVHRTDRALAPAGMIGAYGWVYSAWATTETVEPFASELRRVLRAHAVANGVVQQGEALFGTRFAPGGGLSEAARRLGSSYRRIRHAAEAEGALPAGHRRGVATALPETWLDKEVEAAQAMLGVTEVAAMLGVGRGCARGVLSAGLLPPRTILGVKGYRRADVEAFLTALRGSPSAQSGAPEAGEQRLPQACRTARLPVAAALGAIMSGRLAPSRIDGNADGLLGVIVRYADLRALVPATDWMSVKEAARRLHMHQDSVRSLLNLGLLGGRAKSKRISLSSLLSFEAMYVSNAALAYVIDISPSRLQKVLARKKILPVFEPPSVRNIIFHRAEVQSYLSVRGTFHD
jgi:hypothetical protein